MTCTNCAGNCEIEWHSKIWDETMDAIDTMDNPNIGDILLFDFGEYRELAQDEHWWPCHEVGHITGDRPYSVWVFQFDAGLMTWVVPENWYWSAGQLRYLTDDAPTELVPLKGSLAPGELD